MSFIGFLIASSLALHAAVVVNAHGYLKSPRSRNFVAYQEGVWSGGDENTYTQENCPHCANYGGQCGTIGQTNYNVPQNVFGQVMPKGNPQLAYRQGQEIEVDVILTAHHKGHFLFYGCPLSRQGEVPTKDCFESYPLEFVSDPLYGAPRDPNYPHRAYIPPLTYSEIIYDTQVGVPGSLYRYRMKLPNELYGDLVLLQWHYLTANSCTYDGYNQYNFPAGWGSVNSGLGLCGPLSDVGHGLPEQFWNCAEISIQAGPVAPGTTTPLPPPAAPASTPTTPSGGVNPAEIRVGTPCGEGVVGNGICQDPDLCCSQWGWCGMSTHHCYNKKNSSVPLLIGFFVLMVALIGGLIVFVRCYRKGRCRRK